jgi:hypothetical protein
MGRHHIGVGLQPGDRQPILDWLTAAWEGCVQRRPDIARRVYAVDKVLASRNGARLTGTMESSKSEVRAAIAAVTDGRLHLDVLYQSKIPTLQAIVNQLCDSLDLPPRAELVTDGRLLEWQTDELSVEVHAQHLGELGDRLNGIDGTSIANPSVQHAIKRRAAGMTKLLGADTGMGAFIELGAKGSFGSAAADPKFALRLGAAAAGRVSQFISSGTDEEESGGNLIHRVQQAYKDLLLRQFGVQLGPLRFPIREANVPEPLQYLGIWLINQTRMTSPSGKAQCLPVVIWMASNRNDIRAFAPGFDHALPYPKALQALAGTDPFVQKERKGTEVVQFFQGAIEEVSSCGPVLLLSHAQNLRNTWGFLQDKNLTPDMLEFLLGARLPVTRLPGLRHVRIRTQDQGETPECYAVRPGDKLGFSDGLWLIPGSGRVFGSTARKAQSSKLSARSSKLMPFSTRWGGEDHPSLPRPEEHAWNAQMAELTVAALQPGDDPWVWAAIAHELRMSAQHFTDATVLPLPLHLAKKMEEYVYLTGPEQ